MTKEQQYEYQLKYRREHIAAGLCACCNKPLVSKTLCQRHLERNRLMSAAYHKKYPEKSLAYMATYRRKHRVEIVEQRKKMRLKLRSQNRCVFCGKQAINRCYCERHRIEHLKSSAKWYSTHKEERKIIRHKWYLKNQTRLRAKQNAYYARKVAKKS